MEEVCIKELDARLHKQIENVRKALDTNPSYSVSVMSNIVERHPECLEARKILRKAQWRASAGKLNVIKSFFSKLRGMFMGIGNTAKIKKNPSAAMSATEKVLNTDPSNVNAHRALATAAETLGLHETVAFAREEIYKIDSKNAENVKNLMSAYINIGKNEEAIRIGDQGHKEYPTDDQISLLIRKASVEQSISKGKWEEGKDFREKLKDEEESQKLEQAAKAKTGEAGLRSLIEEAEKAVVEQPEDLNLYREIFY